MRMMTLGRIAGLALAATALSTTAWAQYENCVNIVGNEAISEGQSLDPAQSKGTDDAIHVWPVYDPLIRLSDELQPIPQLATSWEPNADGTQWTFHLREGVTFHDGSAFDAADVVYTYRRLLDPATASPGAAELTFLTPEGIEAVDAATVRFTTATPVAELPVAISTKFAGIVSDGATTEQIIAAPNGTGPFVATEVTQGAPIAIYTRNPDYWDAGSPKAECLRITANDQPVSLTTALLAGDADFAPYIDATTAVTLKDNPDITVHTSRAGIVYTLSMMVDRPPFDNLKLRQAMKLVMDRQGLVDASVLGFGEPANDNPHPPSVAGAYRTDVIAQDIEGAKALLAEAGYPDGIEVDIYTADVLPGLVNLAEAYAQMAAEAGITVKVNRVPTDSFWTDTWMKQAFVTDAWSLRPIGNALNLVYRSGVPWNETAWARPDFDALLDQARVEVDDAKRADLYNQAQKMLTEEGGVIAPVFAHALAAMRSNCSGYTAAPSQTPDFRQISCTK
ncbi:MAG: ABC transporter substrate-binding protein [Alphaproteobacteria bacterium]|nr:ABC transporter substrate-binding protein [Alphaproteobacteria bacterium]